MVGIFLFLYYLSVCSSVEPLSWEISQDITAPAAPQLAGAIAYTTYDNILYYMGGQNGQTLNPWVGFDEVYKWDYNNPATWTKIATIPTTLTCPSRCAEVINDELIYIIGRIPDDTSFIYVFNISSETFITDHGIPPVPYTEDSGCVVKDDNDYIYIIGGLGLTNGAVTYSQKTQILNTNTNTWSLGSNIPITGGTFGAACAYFDGYIYYFGGGDSNQLPLKDIYSYNILTDNWIQLPSEKLSNTVYYPSAVVGPNNNIYISDQYYVHRFDPIESKIYVENPGPLSDTFRAGIAFSVKDKLIMGSGYQNADFQVSTLGTMSPTSMPTSNANVDCNDDIECPLHSYCDNDKKTCLRNCDSFAIDEYLNDCSQEFDENKIQINNIASDLDILLERVNEHDVFSTHINTLQTSVNTLNGRINNHDTDIVDINTLVTEQFNDINNTLSELTTVISAYDIRIDSIDSDIETIKTEIDTLNTMIDDFGPYNPAKIENEKEINIGNNSSFADYIIVILLIINITSIIIICYVASTMKNNKNPHVNYSLTSNSEMN